MNANIRARLVFLAEAIEAGDYGIALDVARDLDDDYAPRQEPGKVRCRFCPVTDWGGLVQRHERIVHAEQLLDLDAARRTA